jgi:hypothetical protein
MPEYWKTGRPRVAFGVFCNPNAEGNVSALVNSNFDQRYEVAELYSAFRDLRMNQDILCLALGDICKVLILTYPKTSGSARRTDFG